MVETKPIQNWLVASHIAKNSTSCNCNSNLHILSLKIMFFSAVGLVSEMLHYCWPFGGIFLNVIVLLVPSVVVILGLPFIPDHQKPSQERPELHNILPGASIWCQSLVRPLGNSGCCRRASLEHVFRQNLFLWSYVCKSVKTATATWAYVIGIV